MAKTGMNCDKTCSARLDVVFVLDLSGSITEYNMIIDFIRQVVYGLDTTNDQVHIGFVTYATDVNDGGFFLNKYTHDREALINAISFNQLGGTTNTQAALKYVQDSQFTAMNGDRSGINNVVILLSDGYSNELEGSSPAAIAGANLQQSGAVIYTVGFGEAPNMAELNALANSPSPVHSFLLAGTNQVDLTTTADSLLTQLCG